jgi:hypothetical protein
LNVGDTVVTGMNKWSVVGVFEAAGGVTESEIWCDVQTLQSVYRRQNNFSLVLAKLDSSETLDQLKDWTGKEHALKADVGCRNTIYNAVPQSGSQYVRRMLDLGVNWFRVELLNETPAEARRLIEGYRNLLDGKENGESLWRELRASNYMGVTRGPLGREE